MMPLLIPLSALCLLFFKYGNYWSAFWFSKWTLFYWMASAVYAWWFAKRTSMWLFPAVLVSLCSAVWLFAWNFNGYKEEYSTLILLSLGKAGAMAFASVILVTFLFQLQPTRTEWRWKIMTYLTLQMVSIFSILYTIGQIRNDPYTRGAFSGNASMNGSLIAALLPFVFQWPIITVLGVFAIGLTMKSIPVGVLGVTVGAWWYAKKGKQHKGRFLLGVGLVLLATVGFFSFHPFNDSGRFDVWRLFYNWWTICADPWIGTGLGSGTVLFPIIQGNVTGGHAAEFFIWAHNEWFQILFETGILGLVSALAAAIYIACKSFKTPDLFGCIMGFFAMGCFNYPLRLPIHTMCFIAVCWLAIQKGGNHGQENRN